MNRIKALRTEHGLMQSDLAKYLGCTPAQISYMESSKRKIDINYAIQLAKFFNVSVDYLLHETDYRKLDSVRIYDESNRIKFIPVIGKIAAGQPILAEENIETYLPVDPQIYGQKDIANLFYLKVQGESMNLKLKNGDFALIRKQDYAESGDIIVAIVNGDNEATIKRYKRLNNQFILLEPMSSDQSFQPITIDLSKTEIKIIGKAIGYSGNL